jgi:hypothetical protein
VNGGWRQVRALKSEGDKVMGSGLFLNDAEETIRIFRPYYFLVSSFVFGGLRYEEIFINRGRATCGAKF